jgi:hypothetical protein
MSVTELPFTLRGAGGTVRVHHRLNEDPRAWGYDVLGLPYDIEVARGCPVVEAIVEHPAAGYAAVMGWIQVVELRAPEETQTILDVAPQMRGAGVPWFSWGPRPVFFDAPSTTYSEQSFRADAFLAVTPDAVMTPVVQPLCGFTWGYDVVGGVPTATGVAPAGPERWPAILPTLRAACPRWTFRALGR